MFGFVKIDPRFLGVDGAQAPGHEAAWTGGRSAAGSRPGSDPERQGEAFVVVPGLPVSKGGRGDLKVREALAPPELLLVDPMAPLDLAVLLRAPGPDVPVPDPGSFDAQYEGERELLPVVALQPLDGKREGLPELGEERQARAVMKPPVEAQHPEAGIVVQGGVLKGPAARDLHELHIDLNGLSGLRLLEELHLPGHALAGAAQARQPEVPEDPLNRAHGEPDPVGALEPEPGPRGPVAELLARASRISSIATGVTCRSRCRAYAGTSPSRPSRRQRRRHRRIVRALIP